MTDLQLIRPGVHFGSLGTARSSTQTKGILRGANQTGLERYLQAHPLRRIDIGPNLPFSVPTALGEYRPASKTLMLESSGRKVEARKPFIPGKSWSVSGSGSSSDDAIKRTFVHELGHHMLWESGAMEEADHPVKKVIEDAFKQSRHADRTITGYARVNWREYFCETHSAYVFHRKMLQKFDPIGYNMVVLVRQMMGVAL